MFETGKKYLFTGFGRTYILEYVRPQYDQFIFKTNKEISYYWCNTMGGKKGITFSGWTYVSLPMSVYWIKMNEILWKVNDWIIDKMFSVCGSKIGQSNLAINIKIAKSMLLKAGVYDFISEMWLKDAIMNSIDIIDIKQYEWEKLCESQVNQLPFNYGK